MKKLRSKSVAILLAFFFITFLPSGIFAKGGGGGGGGSRSYSGGSSSSGGSSRSYGGGSSSYGSSRSYSSGSSSSSSSSSRSYSGGSSSSGSSRSYSTPSVPSAPSPSYSYGSSSSSKPKTNYDSAARQAQQKQESKKSFDAAKAERVPQQTTTSSRGYQDQRVRDLKRDLSYAKMENRNLRQQQTFGGYYGRATPYHYNDGFNIWFWLWLMDRPHHERDTWVYNHRDQMDPARYEELKRNDKDLENRLKALEENGATKDPTYAPSGIDKDLMYSDEKVAEVYKEANTSKFPWGWLGLGLLAIGLIYLMFFARMFRRRA